ncbi:recombinase family protein [Asticcacaulis benevestitus]|nr:recombinase family protein [Asticcacaulis benevestitus]
MDCPSSGLTRKAAQYLRTSTNSQQNSMAAQAAIIAEFAAANNIDIVRTYADEGKSGLTLQERPAFSELLQDVWAPIPAFSIVLVSDVTRWGRFLDADQGAAYEFFCREAGVHVEYVNEAFENDQTFTTAAVKHVKRVMAGEYCRELSRKVSRAHVQQAKLGYFQGAPPRYGYRRLLIDTDFQVRGVMQAGEVKAHPSDKVLITLGPEEEVKTIQLIFKLFVDREMNLREIAAVLNRKNILSTNGHRWNFSIVKSVLKNELVIGNYVYNKTTKKLKSPHMLNPESEWVRVSAVTPIVRRSVFIKASEKLKFLRHHTVSDGELIATLRKLLKAKKTLSWSLVDACPYTQSASTYHARLGGFWAACELVGFSPIPVIKSKRAVFKSVTNEKLLRRMRKLFATHGKITASLINNEPTLPGYKHIAARFGSLATAYALAGFEVPAASHVRLAPSPTRPATPWSYAEQLRQA